MSYEVVDFRKPVRVSEDIGHMLTQWQVSTRETAELRLGKIGLLNATIQGTPPVPLSGANLRALEDSCVFYRIDVKETGHPTLMAVSLPLALMLVSEMMGDSLSEVPEARELTAIEFQCLDFVVEEFRTALESSQQLSPRRTLKVLGRVRLKELHTEFPGNATNTDVGFSIGLPCGQQSLRWILPQDATVDMVASFAASKSQGGHVRKQIESLISSSVSEMRIRLGCAHIELDRLSSLKPGDVLMLDQKLEEPFAAILGGKPIFLGWGARVGSQQAFQIDEVLET